jgi:hypothetical protein
MQLAFAAHLPFRRTRPSSPEHAERPAKATRTQSARRAAACDDKAFYACGCGYAFTANVSTTVGCPHCGTAQAW